MPPSPSPNRKSSMASPNRHLLVERCSTIRACEPCKRRKKLCNGQRPCAYCTEANLECVYSVISDHPRGVFSTNNARRLSSGSACETCRRRKTKCDGSSPCGYCAANAIECINNSERRKRSIGMPPAENEAIDRIEDRLRRIERLVSAFAPSPLSQSTSYTQHDPATARASSSIHVATPPRPQRHSVQGISVAKEQAELRAALQSTRAMSPTRDSPYATPPHSGGKKPPTMTLPTPRSEHPPYRSLSPPLSANGAASSLSTSPPPPLSPSHPHHPASASMLRQASQMTHPLTSSMLNLSLSPSSSTSSSASMAQQLAPQSSLSAPLSLQAQSSSVLAQKGSWSSLHQKSNDAEAYHQIPSPPVSSRSTSSTRGQDMEWKSTSPMPSLMEQLSKRTFATTALEYPITQFPIYPLTPPLHHTSSPDPSPMDHQASN
ncbi:uncharacterized protein BYT42DRAFT_568094 [Radiomyces spectabilis]|uniref:uncharacterized protein n=1 Tax=Radiomyces spectabilis TaxID=64574 RepID=UPI00221E40EF|nr:uncharacterized protein BYT42DRAFT_568094 [Radiomyces spectabilis]KAI8379224.1 hypothetical protein BYT42DRAFT_568094 [Radiomyces spectabilis]